MNSVYSLNSFCYKNDSMYINLTRYLTDVVYKIQSDKIKIKREKYYYMY